MQPEPPNDGFEVSPPSPEERARPADGLGWNLVASLLGHGSLLLVLVAPRCSGWIVGEMRATDEALPAYTVIPIDAATWARLAAQGTAEEVPVAPPDEADPKALRPDAAAPEPTRPDEPARADEVEPIALPDDVEYRKFLEVDEGLASDEDVTDADYIGARDALPAKTTKAPVTADEAGPRMPLVQSAPSLPARARPEIRQGNLEAPRDEVPGGAVVAGGPKGASAGAGAPGSDGDGREGGDAAPRSEAMAATDGAAASPGTEPSPSAPEGLVLPSDPVVRADARDASPESATDSDAVALVERADDGDDRGGSEATSDEAATPSEQRREADGTGADQDDLRGSDPVADLREALGWGAVDRDDARASPGNPSSAGQVGGAPSSPQGVVLEDVEIGFVSWARVADDPLGRYTELVYSIVRPRWHEHDLTVEQKALGIQGRAVVEFAVYRNGRVANVHIWRESGHDAIDALALAALPDRLPKFPRDLDRDVVQMRIGFTYANNIISGEHP